MLLSMIVGGFSPQESFVPTERDEEESDNNANEPDARAAAEAERQRAKYAERERRKQVSRRELERKLSDIRIRHNGRILAAKSAAADSEMILEKVITVVRNPKDRFR